MDVPRFAAANVDGECTVDAAGAAEARLVGGRYRLLAQIGEGGMGRVWEARDTVVRRTVAVKQVPLPGLTPEERAARLESAKREGVNAGAFSDHPNIATIHDVVLDGDSYWIVMQLVKGRSLRHVLRDPATRLGLDQVVAIARDMLAALGTIHAAGLVHRDVKPANIMLAEDGRALLIDFGIAKSDSDPSVTVSGTVVGTMAYLAPERAYGKPGTPASDLFSLGVTLFEAVEGYSPFENGSVSRVLPPMLKAGPLAPLISALTVPDPVLRANHAQARQLLAAATAPPPQPPRAPSPRPEVLAGIAGIAILAIAGVIVGVLLNRAGSGATACGTWRSAKQQRAAWGYANPMPPRGTTYAAYVGYAAKAAVEAERMSSAENEAAGRTDKQPLKADLLQASADHRSMSGIYQTDATGANDAGDYDRVAQALDNDEARIQTDCASN